MPKVTLCATFRHLSAFCSVCSVRVHSILHVMNYGTPEMKFYCKECCPEHGLPLLNSQVLGSPMGVDSKHRNARGQ